MDGQSADKNFAYILGTYMSDGCISLNHGKWRFALEVMDEDFADRFAEALSNLGHKIHRYKIENKRYKQGFSFFVTCVNQQLCQQMIDDTKNKTTIPTYVKSWCVELKKEFISAMMDGEGYICKRTKIMKNNLPTYMLGIKMEENVLEELKRIMQSIGLQIGKTTRTKTTVNVQTATILINLRSWIDVKCYFYIKRKQNKVEEYIRNINLNDYTPNIER